MMADSQLRNLPSVDKVMRDHRLDEILRSTPRAIVVDWVRRSIDLLRNKILAGDDRNEDLVCNEILQEVLSLSAADVGTRMRSVINATGIILHTNLGRAPLAQAAIERMVEAARYCNVEMNLETGQRNRRATRVCELLSRLTGAEASLVVNNCAAATLLVLQAVASGREVIVSRGQLVEIGGGYRLPEVFASSGAKLREVGTTNRTYIHDYEREIGEKTAAIIRVHRSNFSQQGFVHEPELHELVTLGNSRGIPVIDDIGSGCLHDLSTLGLREPVVFESVRAGAALVLFSGDKLFGGPQSGLIVGQRTWINVLEKNPMMRALRADKLILAALEATVECHLSGGAFAELPVLVSVARKPAEIQAQCENVCARLQPDQRLSITVVPCVSEVGGGAIPDARLESFAIRIVGQSVDRLALHLRRGTPSVLTKIQGGAILLDLRTVAVDQIDALVSCLNSRKCLHVW